MALSASWTVTVQNKGSGKMTGFAVGEKLILTGQILMALCCGIYIPWWFKVFKPEQPHNWIADGAGILLLLIVISGLSGLVFTAAGNSRVQSDGFFIPGIHPLMAGIILYFAMMTLTVFAFHRPVTTELFLINGWLILEVVTVNALYGTECFTRGMTAGLLAVETGVFISNIVLYVLYYRLDQWTAYKMAAVPLALNGIVMLVIAGIIVFRRCAL